MTEFEEIKAGLLDALTHAGGEDRNSDVHRVEVPVVDVKAIRTKLEMTQAAFAEAFGVSVATVRNWEQGRRIPRGPARVLLNIIEQEPDAVQRVLGRLVA